jgi:signal transduction histidine kinase/ligand-binding sensor domain-containing protein
VREGSANPARTNYSVLYLLYLIGALICATMRRVSSRSARLGCVLLACAVLLCARSAFAVDPSLDISQYAHTAWKVRDGFAKGAIFSIAQTTDGYLWLGTEFGLFRFDGVRAVAWQPPAGEQLPSDKIRRLLVAPDGTLWIATQKGLASVKDGKLTNYPEVAGQVPLPVLQSRDGTVWFGASQPGRLCAVEAGKVRCYGDGSFGAFVTSLHEDHYGHLWVTAEGALWRWAPGPAEQYKFPRGVTEINSMVEDDSGALLLATNGGLKQLAASKIRDYVLAGSNDQFKFRPNEFLRSSGGSFWIGTQNGLLYSHDGRIDHFTANDGLSGDFISAIFEDREGSIWVGTLDGLDRFREFAVPTVSTKQGLSASAVMSVQATPDGSIWVGTTAGLNRWANGRVTVLGKQSVSSLGLDDEGQLLVSTHGGISYFQAGGFVPVPNIPVQNTSFIGGDGHGNLWVADYLEGLFYLKPGGGVQTVPRYTHGKAYPPLALQPDQSPGGLWLGFGDGGVSFFKDGQVRSSYTVSQGLGKGAVYDLRFGLRRELWAATEGGLSRIKNGQISTFTSKNGLPCDEVHWSIEDDEHFFWLYTQCGLVRVARSELDASIADSDKIMQTVVLDARDGVRSASTHGYTPQVTKSPDGKIWFLTPEGVGVIDPRHLPFNKLRPPVHVEQITADRKTYWQNLSGDASSLHPRLPPLVRDLTIDYTALSLVVPEKVLFRYKLEGWDRDWQDVGNRRQAFYNNLSPGNYRFRVTASNNSGVWNEAGTFMDFSIAPAYYQTNWFRLSCVIAFMAMLWGFYQLRLRQMTREFNAGLEARVNERTRIARDLHDTLLQSFHGLLLRFQTISNTLPPGDTKQKLDSAIDQAAEAITEGRDAVQELRRSTVASHDLAGSISVLGQDLAAAESREDSAVFRVTVEGTPRTLHPILRDELYRIAGEALRNAFRHAAARQIEVEVRYDERQLRLRVRDDGKGIDPKVLKKGQPAGHYGLPGMRERSKLIGGKLIIWSELGSGTEVELSVPASHAYEKSSASRRSWLTEKLTGKFVGKDTAMKS